MYSKRLEDIFKAVLLTLFAVLTLPAQDDLSWDDEVPPPVMTNDVEVTIITNRTGTVPDSSTEAPVPTDDPDLELYKQTFLFGTHGQQYDLLGRYLSMSKEKGERGYFALLNILTENVEDPVVLERLMQVIYRQRLTQYYPIYESVASNKRLIRESIENNDIKAVHASLRYMNKITNENYLAHMVRFYKDKNRFRKFPELVGESIKGIGIYKKEGYNKEFKSYYYETEQEYIRECIIKSIAEFTDESDIPFFYQIVTDDGEAAYLKWVAVIALMKYPQSEKAYEILTRCYAVKDLEIKARAVYAMSYFTDRDVVPMLIKAAKDNSPKVRYFAVSGMKNFNNEVVNTMLKYKYKYDTEYQIRDVAKKILLERGLIEEEKKAAR